MTEAIIINGLIGGRVYALLAVSFPLIFGVDQCCDRKSFSRGHGARKTEWFLSSRSGRNSYPGSSRRADSQARRIATLTVIGS